MLNKKGYRTLGFGLNKITRRNWIRNWREKIFWEQYFDIDMIDCEDAITKYCESNDLEFEIDGCWLKCISNRKQYNDIQRICDRILCRYEEEA